MKETITKTIHVLRAGRPLCGFSTETPDKWPSDHLWTQEWDVEHITCEHCKRRDDVK